MTKRDIVNIMTEEGRRTLQVRYDCYVSCLSERNNGFFSLFLDKAVKVNTDIGGLVGEIKAYAVANNCVFAYNPSTLEIKVVPLRKGAKK